jgi:hypothetical protein
LTQTDPRGLFELLGEELRRSGIHGELFVVGGAVMCLAYAARPSSQDVADVFRPPTLVRTAAARAAVRTNVRSDWLSGAVKAFLTSPGDTAPPFVEFDHLRIMVVEPEYLMAMKCLAMRNDSEFQDEDDVRYLLRLLEVRTLARAATIIEQYYPIERFSPKTPSALQALLSKPGATLDSL